MAEEGNAITLKSWGDQRGRQQERAREALQQLHAFAQGGRPCGWQSALFQFGAYLGSGVGVAEDVERLLHGLLQEASFRRFSARLEE